jgi:SecD/SecF fusion protein
MFETFLPTFLAQAPLGDGQSTVKGWDATLEGLTSLGIMVAAVAIPFLLSRFFSKQLKMPTHNVAFFWILLAVLSSAFVLATGKLKLSQEIVGGINLIYEIDRSGESGTQERKAVAKDFLVPLAKRLDPSGTKELLIRPIGEDQIEIVIPDVDPAEKASIQKTITSAGILQFKIVANANDHKDIIDAATAQANSPNQNVRMNRDVEITDKTTNEKRIAGIWRPLGRGVEKDGIKEIAGYQTGDLIRNAYTGRILTPPPFNKPNEFERWVASQKIEKIDVLLALEKFGRPYAEVSGADLKSAKKEVALGGYQVNFTMSVGGAQKMLNLTAAAQPTSTSDFKRRMAILLDGSVLSAPSLNSPIRDQGMIEGNFTEEDVEFLTSILNAGSLPGALSKEPISENTVGASMGRDAITKSTYASMISLIVTILCVLIYYRFSGFIATVGLLLNLAMILAVMIMIKQPLTLSGMAGLVLSVGMSVDANVLVFERIREETERKASTRMAIRNGFDRAWTTIFDSNLTTLISAIVLYFVGTEQIKGFAITLIIGLVISLFTAVFVTHKLFEIADRWKFAWLGMSDYVNTGRRALFGNGDIDFMKYRFVCYAGSITLIVVGLIATAFRGRQILDIDFNGGTSVVFSLDQSLPTEQVREITEKAFDKDESGLPIQKTLTNVEMKEFEKNTVYKLDVSIKDGKDVTSRLLNGFKDASAKLVTFDVSAKPTTNTQSSATKPASNVRLVAFQEPSAEVKSNEEIQADASKPTPGTPTNPPATKPASDEAVAEPVVKTTLEVTFKNSKGSGVAKMNSDQVIEAFILGAKAKGMTLTDAQMELMPKNLKNWDTSSAAGDSEWTVTVPFDAAASDQIVQAMRAQLQEQPVFQSISKIESRVAGEMQQRAIAGLVLSLVFIVAYIWFRFQKIAYGLAAVVGLIHDVLITLTFIAISHWLFQPLGFLLIDDFKISLTIIAAFLTIIGYSLNDTIVVFDRIREVKGKSPNLTEKMINASVTQTLSRTLLTSSTTIAAILLMYIFGGEGIHGFAFCLFIGIIVGTYSSIFIAAPILLWLVKREQTAKQALKVNG